MTQAAIADKLGYNEGHLQARIVRVARRNRDTRVVSPLLGWQAAPIEFEDETPAPEVEATSEGVMSAIDADLSSILRASREWMLRLEGNELQIVEAPIPAAPAPPTDADLALMHRVRDRAGMLGDAVRMLQHAAGIPADGIVGEETLSMVAGLSAWQSMT